MDKTVSVVIATYNRPVHLVEVLRDLSWQSVPPSSFEVIVVDDGSREPVAPKIARLRLPYRISVLEQENRGAAAARHAGILAARGELVIVIDDDMDVSPDLLAAHLEAHEHGATLVLGHIVDAAAELAAERPLFELFHARQLGAFFDAFREGRLAPHGVHVCTGNVSFRRADYLAVGGFDETLPRSEDRDLGARLERAGARLAYADHAVTVHRSDHGDQSVWFRRNYLYGVSDARIAAKCPTDRWTDPWRYLFEVNPVSRPLLLCAVVAPTLGDALAHAAMGVANGLHRARLDRLAVAGATLAFGLEYFRGVRDGVGSLGAAMSNLRGYVRNRSSHEVSS